MSTEQVHALIPAAGHGTRYGGAVLKQYLPVCGKAVLAHSIRAFQFHPLIAGITVILAEDDQLFASAVGQLSTVVDMVIGGDTRAQSVRNGLQSVSDKYPQTNWVLIHDAARPCLSPESLDRLLEQGLQSADGAILAMPVGDTLKRAGETQEIVATVDRRGLWAAQTPQLFRLGALSDAIDLALRDERELTDEASAMEFAGARPKLVMGSAANIKITHSSDLAIAEAWLKRAELAS
ncbi:MAG: 2-C-methyl-D-erythritol 4-phosphate cytidylyltransferase [Gammaproteobacteria bacterium]|nr:MAG: 2-C-methyl-D-erythritol 4-phosphate cytidylyltransferase [Gammaproteobacteria bacterium]